LVLGNLLDFCNGGGVNLGRFFGLGVEVSGEEFDEGPGPPPFGDFEGAIAFVLGDQGLLQESVGMGLGFKDRDFVGIGEI